MTALVVVGVSIGILEFILRVVDRVRSRKDHVLGNQKQGKSHYHKALPNRKEIKGHREEDKRKQ